MTSIPIDEKQTLVPLPETFDLLEFGNKKNPSGMYRAWYKANGCREYRSVDWNGEDGALPLDCNLPIHPTDIDPHINAYDIVTNFGFSEHVTDQESMWRNIHNLTKPGGIMAGVTPHPGDWPHHGILQPQVDFYWALAERNGYKVDMCWVNEDRRRRTVCYRFRRHEHRNHLPFAMPSGWQTLIHKTEQPSDAALRHSRVKV